MSNDYYIEVMNEAFDDAMAQMCRREEEEKREWHQEGPESEKWKQHRALLQELRSYMNGS